MTHEATTGDTVDLHLPGYSVRGQIISDNAETVRVQWADGRVTDEFVADLERVRSKP